MDVTGSRPVAGRPRPLFGNAFFLDFMIKGITIISLEMQAATTGRVPSPDRDLTTNVEKHADG
jgi:hypothetical protein